MKSILFALALLIAAPALAQDAGEVDAGSAVCHVEVGDVVLGSPDAGVTVVDGGTTDAAVVEAVDAGSPAGADAGSVGADAGVNAPGFDSDKEALDSALKAVEAVKNGAWYVVLGFLLMLATYLARKFNWLSKVPVRFLPWVTVALGGLVSVGESLFSGHGLGDAISNAGAVGTTAVFLWEGVFKHLAVFKSVKPAAPASTPAA